MEQMLKHKPVREASHVFSLACAEILPCYWEEKHGHVHGIDFPEVQDCIIPGIPQGQAANRILCAFLTVFPFTVGSPQRFFLKKLLHSPVYISWLTHLLLLIFYLLHPDPNKWASSPITAN